MAFKRVTKRIVTREVEVMVPIDGKAFDKATLQVTFEILPSDELNKHQYDEAFFKRVVSDVKGYVDENEQPIEFSAASFAGLIGESFVRAAFTRAYMDITIAAPRGN